MTGAPEDRPRRPYWTVPALLVLLMLPSVWAYSVIGAALAVQAAISLSRAALRRAGTRTAVDPTAAATSAPIVLGSEARARTGSRAPARPSSRPRTRSSQVALSEHQLSAHGLILGASGAGKTTTLLRILTEHILQGRPAIAIDMKGSPSFVRRLEAAAAAAGRELRVWTPDGPGHWNPLGHGNATELKDKLISTERFTEPHYQRAAERYVQTVLQVLHDLHPGRPATLGEVVGLMEPPRLSGMLRGLPDRARAERVQDYLAGMTPDQLSAVRGLGTRLAIISESHTGSYLAPAGETLDLRRALDGDEVVVFSLNSSIYGKLSAQLGTLAIQDLIAASGHRLSSPGAQALVGIDEFSALGADNLISLLARGRESGISVILATQELADLDRAARGFRDQVLGVTAVKIIHRQEVHASARTIADMIGSERVWDPTYQIGRGPLGGYSTSRGTRRLLERHIVHPDVIKSLGTGDAVVTVKLPEAGVRVVRVEPPRGVEAARRPAPSEADRPGGTGPARKGSPDGLDRPGGTGPARKVGRGDADRRGGPARRGRTDRSTREGPER